MERLTVMENLLCGRLGYVPPLKAWLRQYPQTDIERAFDLLELVGFRFCQPARRQPVGRAASASASPCHHAGTKAPAR